MFLWMKLDYFTQANVAALSLLSHNNLDIGYHLPHCHRSNRGVKRKKHYVHPFIVASFNVQTVIMARLTAHGDEAKTVELAPSGFDMKSFPCQSQSRGGGIATIYKSIFGSNITFKTDFDFTHTLFKVVQAANTLQHTTFICSTHHPTNKTIILTLCLLNSCLNLIT